MKNEKLFYIGAVIITLLLVGTLIFGITDLVGNSDKETNDIQNNINPELEKYRSLDIPEECRLPGDKEEVESWIEHLGHHENTWYCLDYYK